MSASETWTLLSPVLTAVAAGLVALLLDGFGRPRAAALWAALVLAVGAALGFALGWGYEVSTLFGRAIGDGVSLGGPIAAGGWISGFTGVLLGLAAIIVAADSQRIEREDAGPVAALVALGAAASAVLAGSRDIIMFVVALETVALCSYAYVAAGRSNRSDEAAMKYFVQGAVMTGLLLYGMAILYGLFGTGSSFAESFAGRAGTSGAVLLVMAILAAAVAFKMSAFPFHWWAPDALETAPAGPAAALASVPKAAMLVVAGTLFGEVLAPHASLWGPMFAGLAVASIAYGNLAALRQVSYQRMLAYSGVAQAGYGLSALVAMGSLIQLRGQIEFATFSIRLFALTYALAVVGAFLVGLAVRDGDPDWDGTIGGMAGLATRRPALAFAATVCLLSLTGIPLTAGFWGKFWVFLAVAVGERAWLAVVGFIGSVVSFGYYGAVLRAIYLDRTPEASESGEEASRSEPAFFSTATRAAFFVAIAILAVGLMPLFWGFAPLQTFLGF